MMNGSTSVINIMLITYLWVLGFCIGMICTIPVLGMYHLVRLTFKNHIADRFAYYFTRFWARSIISTSGSKVTVIDIVNLATEKNICYISNHQSLFDIPVLMGWLGRPVGFIAKKELEKIPVLNGWIKAIHSAFIDRSSARKAIDSLNQAAEEIKLGHAIVIFPEGSRSKNGQINEFKTGSLRLAFNSNAIIQPITIIGTRMIFEANRKIRSSKLIIKIHPPIYPKDDIYMDKQLLINKIHSDIRQSYQKLSQ